MIRCLICVLALVAGSANVRAAQDARSHRESEAKHMAKEFSGLGVHRIYVPDFCDSASRPYDRGAFFAATFSELLATKAKKFSIVSRTEVHGFLEQNGLTDCELDREAILSRLSAKFGMDSVLSAKVSEEKDSYLLVFYLRDISGKELSRFSYNEPYYVETQAVFPAPSAASGWPFYFAGLDGVSQPKAEFAPNIDPQKFAPQATGIEVLSVLLSPDGRISQVRLVHSLGSKVDDAAIEKLKLWRLMPAKAPDGSPVPVRIPIVFSFRVE
jgi:TonB family protein